MAQTVARRAGRRSLRKNQPPQPLEGVVQHKGDDDAEHKRPQQPQQQPRRAQDVFDAQHHQHQADGIGDGPEDVLPVFRVHTPHPACRVLTKRRSSAPSGVRRKEASVGVSQPPRYSVTVPSDKRPTKQPSPRDAAVGVQAIAVKVQHQGGGNAAAAGTRRRSGRPPRRLRPRRLARRRAAPPPPAQGMICRAHTPVRISSTSPAAA